MVFFVSDLEQFAFLIVRHHGNGFFFSFMCTGAITCMIGGSKLLAVFSPNLTCPTVIFEFISAESFCSFII